MEIDSARHAVSRKGRTSPRIHDARGETSYLWITHVKGAPANLASCRMRWAPPFKADNGLGAAAMIYSTEILHILAANNCHLVLEKGAPAGRLKRDFISVKTEDGRDVSYRTLQGAFASSIEVPREILDDFIQASLLKQDGLEDSEGRTIFRLTIDGKIRGHDRASALREVANYVAEHSHIFAYGPEMLSHSEKEARRIRILDVGVDIESLA
jgi:hypothetical protein